MVAKISVITVCKNPGPIVIDAIRSVQAQTFPNVEHVVIDGGSNDGTIDRLGQMLRCGDRFISEPDKGIYDAMNKGLARATGDVIAILNADDRYARPDVLGKVARQFAETGADAVLGDATYFRPGRDQVSVRRFNSGRFRPSRIGWGLMPVHAGMMLTRDAYGRVGPYRTDYGIAGDFEFVARAFRRHRLTYSYVRDVFVKMQTGGASGLGRPTRGAVDSMLLRACRENGIFSNGLMIRSRYLGKALELLRV